MEPSVNYTNFMNKLMMIRYFYLDCHMNFDEIAWIVDSKAEVIQLYCKKLLN